MVIGRDYRAPTGGGSSDRGIRYWDKTTTEWRLTRPHRQRRTRRAQREPALAVSVPGGTVRATLSRRLLVLRIRQCTGLSRDCVYLSSVVCRVVCDNTHYRSVNGVGTDTAAADRRPAAGSPLTLHWSFGLRA